jgi:putative alpha-1,2-mannosidase
MLFLKTPFKTSLPLLDYLVQFLLLLHYNMMPRLCSLLSFLLKVYFGLQYFIIGIPAEDVAQHVNPFIGTEGQGNPGTAIGGGNVFPGAALPFGVVKFGIDTTAFDWTNVDANAGYTPDGYGRSSILHNWLTLTHCCSHGSEPAS